MKRSTWIQFVLASIALHLGAMSFLTITNYSAPSTELIYLPEIEARSNLKTVSQSKSPTKVANLRVESGSTTSLDPSRTDQTLILVRTKIMRSLDDELNRELGRAVELILEMKFSKFGSLTELRVAESSGIAELDERVLQIARSSIAEVQGLANLKVILPIKLR